MMEGVGEGAGGGGIVYVLGISIIHYSRVRRRNEMEKTIGNVIGEYEF